MILQVDVIDSRGCPMSCLAVDLSGVSAEGPPLIKLGSRAAVVEHCGATWCPPISLYSAPALFGRFLELKMKSILFMGRYATI